MILLVIVDKHIQINNFKRKNNVYVVQACINKRKKKSKLVGIDLVGNGDDLILFRVFQGALISIVK